MDRAESWVGGSIEFDIIHFTESHISVRAEKPSLETTLCRTARSHPPNFLQACLNRSLHHREPISASFVSTPTDTMGSAPRPTCPLAALRQRIFNSCGSYRVGIMTGKKSIERMPPPVGTLKSDFVRGAGRLGVLLFVHSVQNMPFMLRSAFASTRIWKRMAPHYNINRISTPEIFI